MINELSALGGEDELLFSKHDIGWLAFRLSTNRVRWSRIVGPHNGELQSANALRFIYAPNPAIPVNAQPSPR